MKSTKLRYMLDTGIILYKIEGINKINPTVAYCPEKTPGSMEENRSPALQSSGAKDAEDLDVTVCEVEAVVSYRGPKREGCVQLSRVPVEFSAKN